MVDQYPHLPKREMKGDVVEDTSEHSPVCVMYQLTVYLSSQPEHFVAPVIVQNQVF